MSVYTHCKKCALSEAFYISIARLNHSGVHWCQRRKVSCLRCVFNKVFEYDVEIKGTVTDRIILKKLEKEDWTNRNKTKVVGYITCDILTWVKWRIKSESWMFDLEPN